MIGLSKKPRFPIEGLPMTFLGTPSVVDTRSPTPPFSLPNISPTLDGSSNNSNFVPFMPSILAPSVPSPYPDNGGAANKEDEDTDDHIRELEEQLIGNGAGDKVEEMKRVQKSVYLRENGCENIGWLALHEVTVAAIADTDTDSSPDKKELSPKLFAPFFDVITKRKRDPDDKLKQYKCLFCGHEIKNRTQMVQHIMGLHFLYYPHKCTEWYVECTPTSACDRDPDWTPLATRNSIVKRTVKSTSTINTRGWCTSVIFGTSTCYWLRAVKS
ncbi:hypothetical protein FRB91_004813 [Serendipita sp. 411]|nr:hypothetical protein FRC18_002209 [Serendipita sp. 400]KAG8841627.1 hypothetical protein FRB91_004813 [Serendipita sp. 411]